MGGTLRIRLLTVAGPSRVPGALPVVTTCGRSERAACAGRVLERAGHYGVATAGGGPAGWARVAGQALEAPW